MVIRPLRPDEIECRIQNITAKGVMLLLYKDARCDMSILDEVFSPFGWKRKHQVINNKEFCTVSIQNPETGEWIDKQDCGTPSQTEKGKGETSDAFKRACFSWGIGRELYTKILIFIKCETLSIAGKFAMVDKFAKFTVAKIDTDNKAKKILHLEIADKFGKIVFVWDNKNPPKYEDIQKDIEKEVGKQQISDLLILAKEKQITEEKIKEKIKKQFKKKEIEDLTILEFERVYSDLEKFIVKEVG